MKIIAMAAAALAATIATPTLAATVFYSGSAGKSDFGTATAGYSTSVEGFEGITTRSTNNIGSQSYGTSFSRNGVTIDDSGAASTLTVLDNTYLNGGNQIRNRFGASTGSVLDAGYGSLTITFASAINSFGIDLATIARGFAGSSSGGFTLTEDGQSFNYNYSGSSGFGFVGVVDSTSFTSITLTAGRVSDDVFDNVTYGVAPAAAAVPEPASWAMMLAGFGVVGGAMRRRQRRVLGLA